MISCLATDLSAAVNEPCQVIGAANPLEVAFRCLHKLMDECKLCTAECLGDSEGFL